MFRNLILNSLNACSRGIMPKKVHSFYREIFLFYKFRGIKEF